MTDLMSQLKTLSETMDVVKGQITEKSERNSHRLVELRRKSRELEQLVFGMGLRDVDKLRKIFDEIDEDKSGSIDCKELGQALVRTGKAPTREQVKRLLKKYDADGNGTLEFEEYQHMIANWDADIAEFDSERERLEAALAAAEPQSTGATRSRKNSRELPETGGSFSSQRSSRRSSRDTEFPVLGKSGSTNNIFEEARQDIAAKLGARSHRRSSV